MTTTPETSPKTSKLAIAKGVAKFAVKQCVSGTLVTLIHQNTETFTKSQKVQLYVGAYLVGSMVADHAWTSVEQQLHDIFGAAKAVKETWDETVNDEPIATV